MASCFDRWEKDPFFSAAEEVQESADRMESVYRRWIHEREHDSNLTGELSRELHIALGTAKWQLEELERAVRSNDEAYSAGEDERTRHTEFFEAIGNQICMAENSLKALNLEEGEMSLNWVRLDEGERDELAVFLSCSLLEEEKVSVKPSVSEVELGNNLLVTSGEAAVDCSKNTCHSIELGSREMEERVHGHRRTASASADIGAWKISVSSEDVLRRSFDERLNLPPPMTLKVSGFSRAVESASKMKWLENGFRKCKGGNQFEAAESIPLHNHQLSRGINACYERSKSCLNSCGGEDSSNKQLYGWLGALHRQIQRSQYQIQYGRPIQAFFWVILAVLLIFLFAFVAI